MPQEVQEHHHRAARIETLIRCFPRRETVSVRILFSWIRYHPVLWAMDRPMLRAPSESVALLYWTSQK